MTREWLVSLISGLAVVLSAFALSGAIPARAEPAERSIAGVQLFLNTTLVPGGWSSLVRTDRGINMTLHTTDLPPNSADTVWWVIFNAPQNCAHPMAGNRCGLGDIFSNPAAEPSVLYAAGHVLDAEGVGNFGGHLKLGDTSGCVPAAIPPHFPCNAGLTNPRGSDVMLVVRSHGDPIPGMVDAQISTFAGGCQINVCANLQASYHQAGA